MSERNRYPRDFGVVGSRPVTNSELGGSDRKSEGLATQERKVTHNVIFLEYFACLHVSLSVPSGPDCQ
ncbi:MAG: hypothetical protein M3O24_01660 [Thermoproteota archaeon]|nr:hypothetical protein [Thermoproteota archaeon]